MTRMGSRGKTAAAKGLCDVTAAQPKDLSVMIERKEPILVRCM